MVSLVTLPLYSKRDILLARQRARQIAVLFNYEPQEQACIAAGTFILATQALRHSRANELCITIEAKTLVVFARPKLTSRNLPPKPPNSNPSETSFRLVKPLPALAADFAAEDVSWLVGQLNQHAPFNLFEEIQLQNHEMLALLHALHVAQSQLRQMKENRSAPAAA